MNDRGGHALLAEVMGTFMMVFAGTGAIVINDLTGGAIGHGGIALTFGLVVLSVIYAIGETSGAHINPAVTIAFWAAKRFPGRSVLPYVLSQITGACLASGALYILFPEHGTLGATLPKDSSLQSFLLELLLTWWLMFVILGVAQGAKEKGLIAGIVIGSVVALEATFAGPISGASMNPARSLGPAIVSGHLETIWIYLLAPTAGALLAIFSCRVVHGRRCCSSKPAVGAAHR